MTRKDKIALWVLAFSALGVAIAGFALLLLGYQLAEWLTQ